MGKNSDSDFEALRRRGQSRVVLLALLFVLPVCAAYLLYFVVPKWMPAATTNQGTLVQPPQPLFLYKQRPVPANVPHGEDQKPLPRATLKQLKLVRADGAEVSPTLFWGKWTFVQIARGTCGDACKRRLYETRQIRIGTGKERRRVRRILIVLSPEHWQAWRNKVKANDPYLVLLRGTKADAAPLLQFFSDASRNSSDSPFHLVYLLDPLGNWVLYYRPEVPAKGIQKDLHHLMRLSQVG